VFGLSEVSVGGVPVETPVTVSGSWFVELLLAFTTATLIVPAAATLVAGTVACNWVAELKVEVIAVPLRVIESPFTKPTPVAVNVNAALPDATDEGVIEVRLKVDEPPPPVIVSVIVPDVVVSGFITLIETEPAAAICAAETVVVSWVLETTAVA
jgi:phenolic acid decarboxylase